MRIRNWKKFQHFKDRRPPWIKLYRDLLDDPDFHALDDAASKTLILLWLLASEDKTQEGLLPDIRTISFRLRLTEKEVKQRLARLSKWLEQDDITMISGRYQDGPPETETETDAAPNGAHPKTEEAELYERGKAVLGNNAGGLIARLLKSKKGSVALARAAIEQASTKQDPREYIGAVIRGPAHERHGKNDPDGGILWRTT